MESIWVGALGPISYCRQTIVDLQIFACVDSSREVSEQNYMVENDENLWITNQMNHRLICQEFVLCRVKAKE